MQYNIDLKKITLEVQFDLSNYQKLLASVYPSKPTRRQRPKAVGGASERGRSALFKNPLFFSGKFLGCYMEAAQNFIRYLTIFVTDWAQKLPLLYWF